MFKIVDFPPTSEPSFESLLTAVLQAEAAPNTTTNAARLAVIRSALESGTISSITQLGAFLSQLAEMLPGGVKLTYLAWEDSEGVQETGIAMTGPDKVDISYFVFKHGKSL